MGKKKMLIPRIKQVYEVEGYTIKTNQLIPDANITTTLTVSSAITANTKSQSMITLVESDNIQAGHYVYARIISTNTKARMCWWKDGGNYDEGYDFCSGIELNGSSQVPSYSEGIYQLASDMFHQGYLKLYGYMFAGFSGSADVTVQLTDLTEIYGVGNEPTNLVVLKSQHPELSRVNVYGHRLIGAGENPNWHNLPEGYRETEYLECTGSQAIDTGIPYPIGTTEIKFTAKAAASSTDIFLVDIKSNFGVLYVTSLNNKWRVGGASTVTSGISSQSGKQVTYTLVDNGVDPQYCTIQDDKRSYSLSRGATRTPSGTYNIYLFARMGTGGIVDSFYEGITKNMTISIDGIILRDYITCIRESDNKPGLYDKVTNQFFVNNRSGEDFIPGPVINRYEITTNDGTIIPLSTPLYKIGDVADTVKTSVGENRKFGVVDLGSLTWILQGSFFRARLLDGKYTYIDRNSIANYLTNKYITTSEGNRFDKSISQGGSSARACYVDIKDSSYTDTITFKQAMQGVKLIYELATPTQTLFPEPYKLSNNATFTDGTKTLVSRKMNGKIF